MLIVTPAIDMERDVVGGIAYEGSVSIMKSCDTDQDGKLTRREMLEHFSHFAVPGGRGTGGGRGGGHMGSRGGSGGGMGGRGGGMGGRGGRQPARARKEL
jgi:hypothetical protein